MNLFLAFVTYGALIIQTTHKTLFDFTEKSEVAVTWEIPAVQNDPLRLPHNESNITNTNLLLNKIPHEIVHDIN